MTGKAPVTLDGSIDARDRGSDASVDASPPPRDGTDRTEASVSLSRFSVLTQHNDFRRTGANLEETALDSEVVSGGHFGKLFARAIDDETYSQPLIVGGLLVNGRSRNVLYAATVNDTIYAFDADDATESAPLWTMHLAPAGAVPPRNTDMVGACNGHYRDFSGNIGIVGTPVIDAANRTLYAVARTNEGGRFVQRLHALDIVDGKERPGSPVTITATVPSGEDGGTVTFDPLHENQRPALVLLGGIVYIGWAGHCDWGPYHGWLIGYDETTLEQKIVFNLTPTGNAGGVWQSGQGPSTDGTDLFVVTGNGTVGTANDPRDPQNRGESFLRLVPSAPTLQVATFFTPLEYPAFERNDLDLGTSGMLLIPGTRLGVAGSKSGVLYVVNLDDMGGLTQSTTENDNVVQTFVVGKTSPERIAGSPVFWKAPDGSFVYVWGENDHLKAYPFLQTANDAGSVVLDTAHVIENELVDAPADPGAMLSVSADGSARGTGIVWASHTWSGDANQQVQPGVLRAFDAATLTELWNSHQNAGRDDCGKFAKFSYPTIANGKVYLGSFSNQICVYGVMN